MKKLVVYGSAYPDIVKLIDAINLVNPEWELLGFIDDKKETQGKSVLGYPALGDRSVIPDLVKDKNIYFFNSYVDGLSVFKERINLLESYGCNIPTLIHPSVDMNHVKIGRGCLIAEGCVIGTKVEIGNFVSTRIRSVICHDTRVEDYSFIGPGVTIGSCLTLKSGSFIGAGATILRTKNVGKDSVVGAGAVVVKDVPERTTVAGVPARKLRKNPIKRVIRRIRKEIKNLIYLQKSSVLKHKIMQNRSQ